MKKHLLEGVKKGAFDEAEATKRFEEWIKTNEAKIEAKKSNLEKSQDDELGKRLSVEKKVNEARAAKLAKKNADLAAKAAAGDKALVETIEEASHSEDVTEETAPETEATAEETPQE
jgi:small subunit ribosomal protein S16